MRLPQPKNEGISQQSILVTPELGGASVRRYAYYNGLLQLGDDAPQSLFDSFKKRVISSPNHRFLGTRKKLDDEKFGEYEFITYEEAFGRSQKIAAGLNALGYSAKSIVGICSINREEWILVDQACMSQNMTTVALYDTLGETAVRYILDHAGICVAFCSGDKIGNLLENKKTGLDKFVHIISFDSFDQATQQKANEAKIVLMTLDQLVELGKDKEPLKGAEPGLDDLAMIMYTSGTTGNPKGALLSHRNFVACVQAIQQHELQVNEGDVHISYLPLAHCFERIVLYTLIEVGGSLGFNSGAITRIGEDIKTLRPTVFVGVPRVFNRFYDKVQAELKKSSYVKQGIFNLAYRMRKHALDSGSDTPLWNTLVFNKMRAILGGRVRYMLTGAAPMDAHVFEFMRVCFCPAVFQGYGLTETCAASCITKFDDIMPERVGPPLPQNECKLVDVPELGYTTKDTPNPRGEVCFKGLSVFKGYHKDTRTEKDEFDSEGWFHTGDIGMWNSDGSLSIIDRKKNMLKLAQGEYIALEHLESIFSSAKLVSQICIHGDSKKTALVAIVVPKEEQLVSWAHDHDIEGDFQTLCTKPEVQKAILKNLTAIGKENHLRGFEMIKALFLHPEPFTVANNLMTPTFKLRLDQIKKKFAKELADLYKDLEG